ncbi:MAG: T9SS type A sorting domain-containing protein [Candidatus Marinimicrobia bacterium]|nr:T9SS type A sorting domain-containing protein [Candidatus Neomarinimicrobiota bacterium]
MNVTISGNNIFDYGIFPGTRGGIFIGHDSHPVLVNTIVYTPNPEENSPQEIYFDWHSFGSSTVTIAYSAVHGGEAGIKTNNYGIVNWLDGNIDEDPLIVDAESGDVHLYEGSPAIDAGTDFFLLDGDTLLDLKPGDYTGSAPDMGAIETFYTSVRPGDTDNNGTVNEFDVLPIGVYFLYNGSPRQIATFDWSPQSAILWDLNPATYADANGDGIVDERDVIAIGVNWGNTYTNTSASFAINPSDATLLNHHREAFQGIFNSLSGESEAVKAMRALLRPILNIQVPEAFNLHQNYPNPFNPRTTIGFELPEDEIVTLTIYNLLGQVVTVPVDKKRYDAGIHTVHLDAGHFSSGIYFYRVEAGSWSATRKMLVIK